MIQRFYVKDFLSFKEAEIEFGNGLNVFTGPSGSGKSILMKSILSSFGLDNADAGICESEVSWKIDEDLYGIENEETNIFKQLKKDKTSYFINNQKVSKSSIEKISKENIRHLSLKDYSDFEENSLIKMIDEKIKFKDKKYNVLLEETKNIFYEWKNNKEELQEIEEQEKKLSELKEFAKYEIEKIEKLNPKPGEEEELLETKKQIVKKEKIAESIEKAEQIFEFESKVINAFKILEIDYEFFDDTMNKVRNVFETTLDRLNDLDNIDIEDLLNRITDIGDLTKRFGSIEEALIYKNEKKIELEKYENIEYSKIELIKKVNELESVLKDKIENISKIRNEYLPKIKERLNYYLNMLYLRPIELSIEDKNINELGKDRIIIGLEGTKLEKISSGEFNRLRLSILALKAESMEGQNGILMLDEIDANLSGEESMSVAKVLNHLSSKYQIFVISHQPQLTSMGDNHFIITKDSESKISKLNEEERINEIARIISGEGISKEAKSFAKELFQKTKQFKQK